MVGVGFHLCDDTFHHLHGLERIIPRGRFRGQHYRVSAVVNRRRDIGRFRPRRHRRANHRFEHLSRDDHRLALAATGAHDAALDGRHFFRRQFYAQVAARHHDGVGLFDDFVEAIDGRWFLELGHDPRTSLGQCTRLVQILGTLHEGKR